MNRPFVSVLVPVLDDTERLKACLGALSSQTYPEDRYETIVVDNGSKEDTEGLVRKYPRAVFLREPRRGSYAARNAGLEAARGEIIAFTDSDCTPAPDWLEKGVQAISSISGCGLLAGKVDILYENPSRPSSAELYERVMAFPQEEFVRDSRFGATANLFTCKDVIEKVGPFDAELQSGGDYDWGRRVHKAGYKQAYARDVRVSHPARRSLGDLSVKIRRVASGIRALKKTGRFSLRWYDVFLAQPADMLYRVFNSNELNGISQRVRAASVGLVVVLITFIELMSPAREG